ncbi:erythromycin esterase-like protein [Dyadobacter jiangsuensis]|uniref:Erythromycin esterase-like protein n=1 Tax=Dyadobacter jiangsuensis TaxID=1591085 RepID=A0A2P8FIH7_9BACT|nr:erythromycin esterase-like protein [Dyadobacter jiangsuensis]
MAHSGAEKNDFSRSTSLLWCLFIAPIFLCSISNNKFFYALKENSVDISGLLSTSKSSGVDEMRRTLITLDASVIAIGEQSHGTSEFFRLRSQLIEMLSADSQVSKIGLEAPMAEVEDLNLYLLESQGNVDKILKSLRLYSYECEEFKDFINKVKEINQSRKKKITFFGFDMQSPFRSLEKINELSSEKDKIPSDTIKKLLYYYSMLNDQVYSHNFSEEDFDSLKHISKPILSSLELASRDNKVFRYVKNYHQFLHLNDPTITNHDGSIQSEIRDSLMALNIENEVVSGGKVVVLAHNGHVQKTKNVFSKSMGFFLRTRLGGKYQTIGLTTYRGTYTAFNQNDGKITDTNPIATPQPDAFEYYAGKIGFEVFFVNNAKILKETRREERPSKYKMMVYGYTQDQFTRGDIFEDFDYLIHIQKTTGNRSFYLN